MIDLKILSIKDLLPITAVDYAKGVSPLSVVVTGSNLNQTSEVFINDIKAPEFVVVSTNRLLVQVPTGERNSPLRKIAAIASTPSATRRSLLHFEVGDTIKSIQGLERLVQAFCKLLLQTPGTDRFRPNEGGGLLKIVGRNVSQGDNKTLQAAVIGAIGRTQDQLKARQSVDRRIPADERLLSASAEAVGFDTSTTTLSARINLSAISGRLAVANITL